MNCGGLYVGRIPLRKFKKRASVQIIDAVEFGRGGGFGTENEAQAASNGEMGGGTSTRWPTARIIVGPGVDRAGSAA